MSEGTAPDAPQAHVRKARLSPIWIIPIVAIGLSAYLGYRTLAEKGPTVTIYFATAEGLEAGKTKVEFKAVQVGTVTDIDIRPEAPNIVVTCEFNPRAKEHLTEGSQFWVVRPRIGAGGISGLGTLVSGAYINFVPGPQEGKKVRVFTGLEQPPEMSPNDPRLRLVLHSRSLGSLNPGSPIYFRQIQVGKLGRSQLSDDAKAVEVEMLIEPEHAKLVQSNSRFWNVGGVDVTMGLGKAEVHTESLESLLVGGVAFDSPSGGKPAAKDAKFLLHNSRAEVDDAYWKYGGLEVVVEAVRLDGVKAGDFVLYKEDRVGSVVSTALSNDSRSVRVHLNILSRYAPLVRTNSVFWNASGIRANLGLTGLHIHTESLAAMLAGGISFATPNSPGARVSSGSVFRLYPEGKDEWLKWSPTIQRGGRAEKHAAGEGEGEKHEGLGHFFHHEGKSEDDVADEPQPHDNEKHGFFHRLRH